MKIDILNLNNSMNNITKTNVKSTSSNNSFDSLFAKATYSNGVKNDAKELAQVSQKTSRYDNNYKENYAVKNNNVREDDSTKPVPKEVKDALKESGVSNEEVDEINSLEDLKDKVEPDKLLTILLSLMNGNSSSLDLSNIKDRIKAIIDADPSKYANITDETAFKNKLIDGLFNKITKDSNGEAAIGTRTFRVEAASSNIQAELAGAINGKVSDVQSSDKANASNNADTKSSISDDILSKVQSELSAALKECLKELRTNKEVTSNLTSMATNFNGKSAEILIKAVSDGDASDNSSLLNSSDSKGEDGFLKNLLSDNNDKISRVTNFMSQFNNMKVDNNAVSDLEKIVINKNTIGTDMIKALKYMQTNDMKDLIVKINPKELGEVVIKITMESGAMKASINAANKEAYNLLNSNLADITSKLQNTDIKIQDISLSLYNEDTTFFKDGSDQNRSGREQNGKKALAIGAIGEEDIVIDNQIEADSNVNILA